MSFSFLRLVNFQSHRDTRIDFDPGVNIICGLSQAGKTALIRGFQLLVDNRPSGARYYSNFAPDKGETLIELGVMDGDTVSIEKSVRRKSDGCKDLKSTTYGLNLPRDEEGKVIRDEEGNAVSGNEFTGGSKDVPDQVRDVLNLTELNIQKQFDIPFLVTSSAGEIARTINRITKLDDVDGWIAGFTQRINAAKNTAKTLEEQSKAIENELAGYTGFEDLQVEVETLQKADTDLKVVQRSHFRLDGLLVKIENADSKLEKIRPALAIQKDIDAVGSLEIEILSLKRQVALIQRLKTIEDRVSNLSLVLSDCQALKEIYLAEANEIRLDNYLHRIEVIETTTIRYREEYNELKEQKIEILRRDKKCPLCFADIDGQAIKRLEKGL